MRHTVDSMTQSCRLAACREGEFVKALLAFSKKFFRHHIQTKWYQNRAKVDLKSHWRKKSNLRFIILVSLRLEFRPHVFFSSILKMSYYEVITKIVFVIPGKEHSKNKTISRNSSVWKFIGTSQRPSGCGWWVPRRHVWAKQHTVFP